jgi:hypothetical protein
MKKYLLSLTVILVVCLSSAILHAQENQPRESYETTSFSFTKERSDVPVLQFHCSRGHHGQWLSDSEIETILIWKDGTIAWKIAPKKDGDPFRFGTTHWYQSTIAAEGKITPAERVEAAVREIAENFAKNPTGNGTRLQRGGKMNYYPGEHFPESINVWGSQHNERMSVQYAELKFYKENRKIFQSDDNKSIAETFGSIKSLGWDYKNLMEGYRERFPNAGLSAKGTPTYREEELLKYAKLYTADMEHYLLMEKKILDFLPSLEGLKPKEPDAKHVQEKFKEMEEEKKARDEISEEDRAKELEEHLKKVAEELGEETAKRFAKLGEEFAASDREREKELAKELGLDIEKDIVKVKELVKIKELARGLNKEIDMKLVNAKGLAEIKDLAKELGRESTMYYAKLSAMRESMVYHYFHVEREVKDGKSEFFYTLVSEEEYRRISVELREKRKEE